jgi:hypothetical protein
LSIWRSLAATAFEANGAQAKQLPPVSCGWNEAVARGVRGLKGGAPQASVGASRRAPRQRDHSLPRRLEEEWPQLIHGAQVRKSYFGCA